MFYNGVSSSRDSCIFLFIMSSETCKSKRSSNYRPLTLYFVKVSLGKKKGKQKRKSFKEKQRKNIWKTRESIVTSETVSRGNYFQVRSTCYCSFFISFNETLRHTDTQHTHTEKIFVRPNDSNVFNRIFNYY